VNRVRDFVAANALSLVAAAAIVVVGVFGGLVAGSLLASRTAPNVAVATATASPVASAGPTARPPSTPSASPSPSLSATPGPTAPPLASPVGSQLAIPGANPDVVAAIEAAAARLRAVDRFHFASGVSGRSLDDLASDPLFDIGMRGALVRTPELAFDVALSTSMVEPGGVAAISQTIKVVVIGNTGWAPQPSQTPRPETLEADSLERILLFLPDAILDRAIVPFAGGYELVGEETRSGVAAIHYRATESGLRAYRDAVDVDGACSADVWIATAGGHAVAAKITCEPVNPQTSKIRGFYAEFEVTDAGDESIEVVPPS
jgi:hypothetical protein